MPALDRLPPQRSGCRCGDQPDTDGRDVNRFFSHRRFAAPAISDPQLDIRWPARDNIADSILTMPRAGSMAENGMAEGGDERRAMIGAEGARAHG